MMTQVLVADMSCGHCVGAITKAIQAADAGARVTPDLASHKVAVESKLSATVLAELIRAAGYSPQPL